MSKALTGEAIRQAWMSLGLVAVSLAGGASVSNERGVFIPISGVERAIIATARALAAMAAPAPVVIGSLNMGMPQRLSQLTQGSRRPRGEPGPRFRPYNGASGPGAAPIGQPQPFSQPQFAQSQAEVAAAAAAASQALAESGGPSVELAQLAAGRLPFFRGPAYLPVGAVPTDPDNPVAPDPDPDTGTEPTEPRPPVAPIPEPASWLIMIAGFGLVGGAFRYAALRGQVEARRKALGLDLN